MSSALRRTHSPARTALSAGVAVALAVVLSGCGAGFRAQTYQERNQEGSTNEAIGALAVRHFRILPPEGIGSQVHPAGSDVTAAVTFVNTGAETDRLVSVTADAAPRVDVVDSAGQPTDLVVGGQEVVSAFFLLRGVERDLRAGTFVEFDLAFEQGGSEAMLVPVDLTGTPGPAREGYHVTPTDSTGKPLVEEGEEEHGGDHGSEGGIGAEGEAGRGVEDGDHSG